MNLASMITEDATVMTIVRDRAERLWRRNGRLSLDDMDYATDSSYIRQDEKRQNRATEYFSRMANASMYISYIMSNGSNEHIYERFFGKKPKREVKIESRPYGIHFMLHDEDWAEIDPNNSGLNGRAYFKQKKGGKVDSRRISYSIGRKCMGIKEFTSRYLNTILNDEKASECFKETYGIGLTDFFEAYTRLKTNNWRHWLKPKWKKTALEMRCEMLWEHIGKDIQKEYAKHKSAISEEQISEHELEHIHSFVMLSLLDPAVQEIASYSTPIEIEKRDANGLEHAIAGSGAYKELIKDEDLRNVIDILKAERRIGFTKFQGKVLPIAMGRSRRMSRLPFIARDIMDYVENIR